jgi:hypothetical protein
MDVLNVCVELLLFFLKEIIDRDQFQGGNLVQMHGRTPKQKDCIRNYAFILPAVEHSRQKVPSAFFLADVFMMADRKLGGKLLKLPGAKTATPEQKQRLAIQDGAVLKACCGYVRYLARNTKGSANEKIRVLKSMVEKNAKGMGAAITAGDDAALEGESADDEEEETEEEQVDGDAEVKALPGEKEEDDADDEGDEKEEALSEEKKEDDADHEGDEEEEALPEEKEEDDDELAPQPSEADGVDLDDLDMADPLPLSDTEVISDDDGAADDGIATDANIDIDIDFMEGYLDKLDMGSPLPDMAETEWEDALVAVTGADDRTAARLEETQMSNRYSVPRPPGQVEPLGAAPPVVDLKMQAKKVLKVKKVPKVKKAPKVKLRSKRATFKRAVRRMRLKAKTSPSAAPAGLAEVAPGAHTAASGSDGHAPLNEGIRAELVEHYNLHNVDLPPAAWPTSKGRGKLSYTVSSSNDIAVDVRINANVFYIKRMPIDEATSKEV